MGPEQWLAIAVTAAAGAALGWWLACVFTDPRTGGADAGRFEVTRRAALRQASATYRWCEPWVDELAARNAEMRPAKVEQLRLDIPASGSTVPWRSQEFLAVKQIEALAAAAIALGVASVLSSLSSAVMLAAVMGFLIYGASISEVARKARRRRNVIRRRFASTFDLVALMLDVGATFPEALKTVAAESRGHPLGEELERLLQNTEMGELRADALKAFGERLADEDIQEMMSSVVEAEELGTPIAETLRTQIEQIRQKRVHWAERTAEEAKVQLVFPAMIIMLACLVIVAAPFILSALFASRT